jgi:hypothetical protein
MFPIKLDENIVMVLSKMGARKDTVKMVLIA